MHLKQLYKKLLLLFLSLITFICLFAQSPGSKFDLSAWKLQTLKESDTSFTEITDSEELASHSDSFFYTDNSDGAMVFNVPSNGGTSSSGTSYPRVELRQLRDGGNWELSDTNEHYLTAQCKVMEVAQVKPKTIIGQIHGSESNSELLKLRWTGYKAGECFVEARFQTNDNAGSEYGVTLASGLSLGDMIDYTITMKQGLVTVTVNGNSATQTYTTQYYGTSDYYYFKAGNYIQWNDEIVSAPPVVYGINKFYKLLLHKETSAILIFKDLDSKYKVYPNPAKNHVTIELNLTEPEDVSLQIFDNIGRIVKRMNLFNVRFNGKFRESIDLSELKPEIYYFWFSTKDKTEIKKLVISK